MSLSQSANLRMNKRLQKEFGESVAKKKRLALVNDRFGLEIWGTAENGIGEMQIVM